jgi:hypothetical protein
VVAEAIQRMRPWIVPLGPIYVVALLALGLWLWLWCAPGGAPNKYSDLGTALIGGALVAIAGFYLEHLISSNAEKRALRVQLGLQKDLSEIDLFKRDLSGFHLANKKFKGANLVCADLRDTNLSGADLTDAMLNYADLRGARMDEIGLYPSETLFPSNERFPGSIYQEATINNTSLYGAIYDANTRWPSNIEPDRVCAVNVDRRWWRRFLGLDNKARRDRCKTTLRGPGG